MTGSRAERQRTAQGKQLAPFAFIAMLGFLTVPLSDQTADPWTLAAAAMLMGALAISVLIVPWQRFHVAYQLVPALLGLLVIALLRHAEGGAVSGYGILVLIPLLWLALYGRRRELLVLIGAIAVTFVVPILVFGEPDYPASEWRRAILFTAVSAFVGLVTQNLVVQGRARAAEATRRARAEAEREAYLRAVMDSAAEGIFALDSEGCATFVNPAAAELCGYSVEELTGNRMHDLVHHSHADGSPYPIEECPVLRTLRTGEGSFVSDEVFWRKDGSSFPVEYRATPMLVDGEVTGAVNTFTDITERLAVDRMKHEFVSVVSHELRTPLTSIRGSLGLMEGGVLGELPEEAQKMLAIAISNADRLVRLINDILDAERIETGKAPMDMSAVELSGLMTQTADLLAPSADAAGVRLDLRPVPTRLYADPDRVIQALVNLIGNAIKFSGEGTTVTIDGEVRDDRVEVRVTDQGPGIPADQRERIFDRFAQVESGGGRAKGGSGLGLAIARGIVEQHGGRIWVESEPDRGSTFAFELPVIREAAPAAGRGAEGRLGVLIVEDDPDLAEVLTSRLARAEVTAAHVGSLADARSAVPTERPRLVILDVDLPDAGADALLGWLGSPEGPCDSKILIYSALDLGAAALTRLREYGPVFTKGRVPVEDVESKALEMLGRDSVAADGRRSEA